MYKPDGYTDVSPYLVVRDAETVMAFAERVFGAERLRVVRREGGGIMHAEIRIGDSVVMMGEAPGGASALLHIYVADAEAAFERAREAGAEVLQEMTDKDDGDLRGGVRDGSGTQWYIARRI